MVSIFRSPDLANTLGQDATFRTDRIVIDPVAGTANWDTAGKWSLLGKIAGDTEDPNNPGNPILELLLQLSFSEIPTSGFLVIDNTGSTQYTIEPSAGTMSWEGDYQSIPGEKNILEFVVEGGVITWRSYLRQKLTTLATFENGTVTFRVNSATGIDDDNHLTPYLTIEHTIREMREKIPFSNVFPNPGGGFSNDRVRSVRIELTGTFNEAVSIHFNNDYAIEIVGMGASPEDTVIFGDDGEAALSLNNTNEISIENLTVNSDFMCVNALSSRVAKFHDCNFISRSLTTPRNIFYFTTYSNLSINGKIGVSGNVRRLINCNYYSSAKISCQIYSPDPIVTFTESFLFAGEYSFLDATNCTLDPALTLEGLAVAVDEIATTVLLEKPFSNLT